MTMREIKIPFQGFYETKYSGIVDNWIERVVENENERQESPYETETYIADERLRVDSSEFAWEFMNYRGVFQEIAKNYTEIFADKINEAAKEIDPDAPDCKIVFNEMTSPRYYNYETDQIFAYISEEFINWMRRTVKPENFAEVIRSRHTSYDGFTSFYENDLESWLEKDIADYDRNDLETLLMATLYDFFKDAETWEWEIFYSLAESDYMICDNHFNFQAWEAKVNEIRAERLEEIQAEIENGNELEIKLAPCPDTLDMFTGKES